MTNSRSINDYAEKNNLNAIKLNLGSGGRPIEGWINIDNFDYEKMIHHAQAQYMTLKWTSEV